MKTFEARVDIGCEFFVQAEATSLEKIMVKVAKDFYVDLTAKETLTYIDAKEKHLNE